MSKTILIVDDDPAYIELVKDILELHHFHACTALNGFEALWVLSRQKVDIVISDIEMPQMNGITLHQNLMEHESLRDIPFIFLTGSEESRYFSYIDEHHSIHLVRKTEMIEKLLPLLHSLLGGAGR